jgi:hypothetical protein
MLVTMRTVFTTFSASFGGLLYIAGGFTLPYMVTPPTAFFGRFFGRHTLPCRTAAQLLCRHTLHCRGTALAHVAGFCLPARRR